ncbi:MAG: Ada metal-binding domain-containing protein [Desulfovibrio sp.]
MKKQIHRLALVGAYSLVIIGLLCLAQVSVPTIVYAQGTNKEFHGNRKSHVFHQLGCRYYECKNCVVVFKNKKSALVAGYRPCKICRP